MIKAALDGRADMIELLVKEGKAKVDQATNKGSIPLYMAAPKGRTEIIKLLVTDGNAEVDKAQKVRV